MLFFFHLETNEYLLNQSHFSHKTNKTPSNFNILREGKNHHSKRNLQCPNRKLERKLIQLVYKPKDILGKTIIFTGLSFTSHKEQRSTSSGKQ